MFFTARASLASTPTVNVDYALFFRLILNKILPILANFALDYAYEYSFDDEDRLARPRLPGLRVGGGL
jgi:hypothetical protein